jgi:hypothetical protein
VLSDLVPKFVDSGLALRGALHEQGRTSLLRDVSSNLDEAHLLEPLKRCIDDLIQARVQMVKHFFGVQSFDADMKLFYNLLMLQNEILATNLLDCR